MIALVRPPGDRFAEALRTFVPEEALSVETARREHAAYVRVLQRVGVRTQVLPPLADHPDATFVEDMAVVLGPVALLGRSSRPSRSGEEGSVGDALAALGYEVRILPEGASLEGGDVLRVGGRVWVGRSSRTDLAGARAVVDLARSLGLTAALVPVDRCLHLKTAISSLDEETVLLNPRWIDADLTTGVRAVRVPREEPDAANVLSVGRRVVLASRDEATAALLTALGYECFPVPLDELRKAEAGPTCLSILLPEPRRASAAPEGRRGR